MSALIRFLPEARAEFDEATDWYERRQAGLGDAFIVRVNEVLLRIASNPQIHPTIYRDVRQGVLKQFPYVVLYRNEGNEVIVVSVFHSARDPAVWQGRIPS